MLLLKYINLSPLIFKFSSFFYFLHGRLARWIKWTASDVGEAKEGLENELWHRWSNGRVGEWAVTLVKRRKGWRMSCDEDEVTKRLDNELCVFRHFTYVTAHSPTLPLLHLRHSSFSNPSFASPTSQTLHLRHVCIFEVFRARQHLRSLALVMNDDWW